MLLAPLSWILFNPNFERCFSIILDWGGEDPKLNPIPQYMNGNSKKLDIREFKIDVALEV